MAKKKSGSSSNSLTKYGHHLIPSSIGGLVAYVFSGVVMVGLVVFVAVWVGNMIGHALHHKS